MAHGVPDWDDRTRLDVVFGFKDDAELAVRLGASSRFHRLGKTVFHDDFTLGLNKWGVIDLPPNKTIVLVDTPIEVGPQAVRFGIVAGVGSSMFMYHYLGCALSRRIGFEIDFRLESKVDYFITYYYLYDGVHFSPFAIKYDVTNNIIMYAAYENGFSPLVSPMTDYIMYGAYNAVKLVVSRENNEYKALIINGCPIDIGFKWVTYQLVSVSSRILLKFLIADDGTDEALGYLDTVAVTLEEPA